MEGSVTLKKENGLYEWHAGAPGDSDFEAGYDEIIDRINGRLDELKLERLILKEIDTIKKGRKKLKDTAEKVVTAYGEALVELAKDRNDIIP